MFIINILFYFVLVLKHIFKMTKSTETTEKNGTLSVGDLKFLHTAIINPKTGKNYSYIFIQKIHTGIRKSKYVSKIFDDWIKTKEQFRKNAAKLAS